MKGMKHFLITSNDGEQIAVVSAKMNEQYESKLLSCVQHHLDDVTCRMKHNMTGNLLLNDPVPFSFYRLLQPEFCVWARRIELY